MAHRRGDDRCGHRIGRGIHGGGTAAARSRWRVQPHLPAGIGPEGLLTIPARNLFAVASDMDDRETVIRSSITLCELSDGPANYPTIPSLRAATFQSSKKAWCSDLIPDLQGARGVVLEKVEGLTIMADGATYIVTDNDGVDDSSGETQFISLGNLFEQP